VAPAHAPADHLKLNAINAEMSSTEMQAPRRHRSRSGTADFAFIAHNGMGVRCRQSRKYHDRLRLAV
jgi:hypothetical protein